MTTRADLKRWAKKSLSPALAARGFGPTPKGYAYMREYSGVWHLLIPELVADGSAFGLVVTAWVPEWALQPYDLASLPNEVSICTGGRLGPKGPSATAYDLWPAASESEFAKSFPLLLERLDAIGIPWLNQVDSREALVSRINPNSATDRFGNRTADKVYGRNLLFRDQVKPIGA